MSYALVVLSVVAGSLVFQSGPYQTKRICEDAKTEMLAQIDKKKFNIACVETPVQK